MSGTPLANDKLARFLSMIEPERASATLDELCQRVAEGETLDKLATAWDVPYGRLSAWLAQDPQREGAYDAALRIWAGKLAMESVGISDGAGDAARDRLRVDTRLKIASKLDRARFGEKLEVTAFVVDVAGAMGEARARRQLVRVPRVIEHEPDAGGDI